jgi:PAS domain S-box-containing protein
LTVNNATINLTVPEQTENIPKNNQSVFAAIRKSILQLAFTEEDEEQICLRAGRIISVSLGCVAEFVRAEVSPETKGDFSAFPVVVNDKTEGTLLVESFKIEQSVEYLGAELQEIAELITLAVLSSRQSEELAQMENESEEMLFFAPDIIFVVDSKGIIKMANQKAIDLVQLDEKQVKGKNFSLILGTQTPNVARLVELAEQHGRFEIELVKKSGRRLASFSVSLVAQNGGAQILMVGRDITKERQAQLALRRSERATLMSQTIDYLLHEVNNPLAALISSVTTATRKSKKLEDKNSIKGLQLSLKTAQNAASRINNAMSMLSAVNHSRTIGGPQSIDAGFELSLAISAAEQENKNVTILQHIENLPNFNITPLHFAEIVGACLKNAVQEVSTLKNPRVIISGYVKNNNVIIQIEDNGKGVDPQTAKQIFMPFYTTKPLGEAIGLGLSMANDMIKKEGGHIEVTKSKELGGACFTLFFPMN